MRQFKPVTPGTSPYGLGNRNRRKAYYRGKYAREMTTIVLFVAFVAMCILRFSA